MPLCRYGKHIVTLLSEKTSALHNSIRCEGLAVTCTLLWPFASLLQFLWEQMFEARHKASHNIKTTFSAWHTTTFLHYSFFRQLHAWKICSLPLSSSYLCLWRPSHQAVLWSRGYWAQVCQVWQLCAQMTCSSQGQYSSEQTSVSSSSERTSCCCSEPLYEASLAQEYRHVNGFTTTAILSLAW